MLWENIFRSLKPNQIVDGFTQINFAALRAKGIRHVICDADNTLTYGKWSLSLDNRNHAVKAVAAGWISALVILSNIVLESKRRRLRIANIAERLNGCEYHCAVYPHIKPSKEAFEAVFEKLPPDATYKNTAMIGDQLFTDIIGANNLGMYTIYVRPMAPEAPWMWPKRWAEEIVFALTNWRQNLT